MRILMIAINDPAGTAILFTQALNRYTDHSCRLVTLETRYRHGWETDLHLPHCETDKLAELERLLQVSDVFHFHMTADEHLVLGPFTPRDYLKGKAVVHHHHGHPDFRGNPLKYQEKYRRLGRRNLLVPTPDLLKLLPTARWQPNLVPVEEPRYTPAARSPQDWAGPLRLIHSPTRRDLKNTAELIQTVQALQSAGADLTLDIIDDLPHRECLARKQASQVCFDHLQGYFGMSSLESLSLGLATVAGLDAWCQGQVLGRTGAPRLPWLVVHQSRELYDLLLTLCRDPAQRQEAGASARQFMLRYWHDRRWAQLLGAYYEHLV